MRCVESDCGSAACEAEFPADLVVDTMPGARVFHLPRGCAGYVRQVHGPSAIGIRRGRDEEAELAIAL